MLGGFPAWQMSASTSIDARRRVALINNYRTSSTLLNLNQCRTKVSDPQLIATSSQNLKRMALPQPVVPAPCESHCLRPAQPQMEDSHFLIYRSCFSIYVILMEGPAPSYHPPRCDLLPASSVLPWPLPRLQPSSNFQIYSKLYRWRGQQASQSWTDLVYCRTTRPLTTMSPVSPASSSAVPSLRL